MKCLAMSARLKSTTEKYSRGVRFPTQVTEEDRADPGAGEERVLSEQQMPTCVPRASEPGWLLGSGPAGSPGRVRGSFTLLPPSERWLLRSKGDDLPGYLSPSAGNVGFVWLSPPPGTEV